MGRATFVYIKTSKCTLFHVKFQSNFRREAIQVLSGIVLIEIVPKQGLPRCLILLIFASQRPTAASCLQFWRFFWFLITASMA
jgi:hypothetical protein